ncbi:CidA/LrgA family protein [Arhodomonas sp. SL1]|uniref:CidA/LrgA family protein n=1 Tax=Arhodomonas sp. SL1 TaxID=3425691 RepID=UPI003F885981
MIAALFALLAFQLAGEVIARGLSLPLPGPVLGMLLLAGAVALRGAVPATLDRLATGLLEHLALLFIPAGVGIMVHLHRVSQDWFALAVTVLASTAITLVVSAGALRWLMRRAGAEE